MVNYRFATLIGLAGMAVAVPLNINLGAYSPALVVGQFNPSIKDQACAYTHIHSNTLLTIWGNR